MEKWVNASLESEARHLQTRNKAQITLQVFNYWKKLPREAVTSPSLSLLTSRVDVFLEDMLSPNTNYQPPYKWKSMKWNILCSTEGPSIQCLDSSGLKAFDFAKGGFSMNQKGSTWKNANRRDFQTQNVETFPHTVGWLCYKLLGSWSQQGCYLQSQCSPQFWSLCGLPEKLLALCKPWPSVTCHDSGLRADVNQAFLPYHNRTWAWLFFVLGKEEV